MTKPYFCIFMIIPPWRKLGPLFIYFIYVCGVGSLLVRPSDSRPQGRMLKSWPRQERRYVLYKGTLQKIPRSLHPSVKRYPAIYSERSCQYVSVLALYITAAYNHSLYSLIVGFTEHVRFVQRIPDLSWPGSFDFNGMHNKQFTVPPRKWHWPMRLKGCLRVLHIGIDPYTRRGLRDTILHGNSHAP
jgi:hypothetical protein